MLRSIKEAHETRWIVIEGPSVDGKFVMAWLDHATKADAALRSHFGKNPGFREGISRLEIVREIEFVPWAMEFIRLWLTENGVFCIDSPCDESTEMLPTMSAMGFFTLTGERYQMTIPDSLDLAAMISSLADLAGTEDDDYVLHPERLLVTMTAHDAFQWKQRLLTLDLQQRLADRNILLG